MNKRMLLKEKKSCKAVVTNLTSNIYLPQNTNNNEIKQNSNTKVARKPKRNHGACRYWAPSE